jgi:hypothetical protein
VTPKVLKFNCGACSDCVILVSDPVFCEVPSEVVALLHCGSTSFEAFTAVSIQ